MTTPNDSAAQRALPELDVLLLADAIDPLTRKGLDNLTCAAAAKMLRALSATAPSAERESQGAGEGQAVLYLQLTDAMGYDSGKDGIEFSPEEWAEALLKDALAYRALAAAPKDAATQGKGERGPLLAKFLSEAEKAGVTHWSFKADERGSAEPAFYARDSDVAALAEKMVAGCGGFLSKYPKDGYSPYFAHPDSAQPPTVEQAIANLVSALVESKSWMPGYADATIRDAIDRTGGAQARDRLAACNACLDQAREARDAALDAAFEACDDVDEPPYYGYENPNTFRDGKAACMSAIRALKGKA